MSRPYWIIASTDGCLCGVGGLCLYSPSLPAARADALEPIEGEGGRLGADNGLLVVAFHDAMALRHLSGRSPSCRPCRRSTSTTGTPFVSTYLYIMGQCARVLFALHERRHACWRPGRSPRPSQVRTSSCDIGPLRDDRRDRCLQLLRTPGQRSIGRQGPQDTSTSASASPGPLASDRVWNDTHRLAAWLMVGARDPSASCYVDSHACRVRGDSARPVDDHDVFLIVVTPSSITRLWSVAGRVSQETLIEVAHSPRSIHRARASGTTHRPRRAGPGRSCELIRGLGPACREPCTGRAIQSGAGAARAAVDLRPPN